MKLEDQIKALAELDGWKHKACDEFNHLHLFTGPAKQQFVCHPSLQHHKLPHYLTSYDAIIPLIQKHINSVDTRESFVLHLSRITGKNFVGIDCYSLALLCCTSIPAQLCEALLRATGKWVES